MMKSFIKPLLICSRRSISKTVFLSKNVKNQNSGYAADEAIFGPAWSKEKVLKTVKKNRQYLIGKSQNDSPNTTHENISLENGKSKITHKVSVNTPQGEINSKKVSRINSAVDPLEKIILHPLFQPLSGDSLKELTTLPFKDMIEKKLNSYMPSVSRILNETMPPESRYFLERWEKQMIEELGEEGFKQFKKETFAKGEHLHLCIEQHLQGTPVEMIDVTEPIQGHWNSLQTVLPDISDVKLMEQKVMHNNLGYCGYFDCIARYRDTLCVIDWKTSKKKKPKLKYTYDNPLQVMAYLGALNFDQNYDLKVESAMIVVAYEDGEAAHAHFMDKDVCLFYWGQWLKRLQEYWKIKMEQ